MGIKNSSQSKIIVRGVILAAALWVFGFGNASAASLSINSGTTTLAPGETAVLSVVVNSGGVAINNTEATITFPADLVSVVSISKINSAFSLWVEDPSFSNSLGTITFNGGVPTPGFIGSQGSVVSIVVKAKAAGQAEFSFADAAVRANDGLGTNVLTSKQGKLLVVAQKEVPLLAPTPTPATAASSLSLTLSSVTHPKQGQWYSNANPKLQWVIPAGADAVQTGMSVDAASSPRITYAPAISEKVVSDLEDGIWYFKARARQAGAWGSVASYIVRIDTVPPEKKAVDFSYDDATRMLTVAADIVDVTSGIDRYELMVNDKLVKTLSAEDFIDGEYSIELNVSGDNTVKVVAIDRAGNSVEASGVFRSLASVPAEAATPLPSVKKTLMVAIGPVAVAALPLGIVLLSIAIVLVLAAYYIGRRRVGSRPKARVRGMLSKGDSLKMMLVLKKRLESHLEILQRTRRSRMLTPEEKEIKQAIEGDLDEVDQMIEGQK
jgi:hypothetical protein